MSKIHLDLFDDQRKAIFDKLSIFRQDGYLAGGTALALQLNHRISYDFDVFVPTEIGNPMRKKVQAVFGNVVYTLNTGDQINFMTSNQIKITFLWYYFTPRMPPIATSSISLASIIDIACDKAQTIGRRAAWRDYIDMYWLLKYKYVTISSLIACAQQKFRGEFVVGQFLEQLVYFDDVQTIPVEFRGHPVPEKEVKAFLKHEVAEYTASFIDK